MTGIRRAPGASRAAWAANSLRDYAGVVRAIGIAPSETVLDVGSGGTPYPRANVLMDKFPDDGSERHGQAIRADRPFVVGDVERIPFADGSFDVAICSHVLEHVSDPSVAIAELERVAHRGYIETPSESWEKLQGFPFHRWMVSLEDGVLTFREKAAPIVDPRLRGWFTEMQRSLGIKERIWFARRRIGIYCSLVWEGTIPHRVIRLAAHERTGGEPVGDDRADLSFDSPAPALGLVDRLVSTHGRWSRRRSALGWADVLDAIRCPACGGATVVEARALSCPSCGRRYLRDAEGHPWLLVD